MRIVVLCACFSLYTVQYVLSMYIIICVPIIYYYLYILHYTLFINQFFQVRDDLVGDAFVVFFFCPSLAFHPDGMAAGS